VNNLNKAGWSCGCVSAINSNERMIWVAETHIPRQRKVFGCCADEKLTAFVELESAIRACGQLSRQAAEISPKLAECENTHLHKF